MRISDRTVLIVGGTSGIGRALAHRFAKAGSTVIIGGRDPQPQDEFETVRIDVTDPTAIARARDDVLTAHPELDAVVTMSGVMLTEDLRDPAHIETAETTIATNLLGTIRVISAFTPHLVDRGSATIVTVSSGIAFVPFPLMPTYGASKAGVHAFTEALRPQLAGTGVEVIEIVPPAVATGEMVKLNPAALPLDDYLDEVMALLAIEPSRQEILVDGVLKLRWAERDGTYATLLDQRSQALRTLH